ncbi:MAG: DMT family transporter [Butyricicoccus sp.]|nr:DMT family transporter [Butyricicoccus sp.]MBQ8584984.1 DMT family transporter [Butyricicoccus sp.]
MTQKNQGILFALLSTILYSLGGLLMKGIPSWDGLALNAGRSVISIFIYAAFLLLTRHKLRMNRWILFGAVNVGLNNALFTLANKMTSAANAVVLMFTAPVFIIILSAIFLKKRPHRLEIITCIVVFGGTLLFFIESFGGGSLAGDFVAVLCGLMYGLTFMLNDMPGSDPISSVFYGAFVGVIIGLPSMLAAPPLGGSELINMLALGALQTGLAYVFLALSLATTPAITASLISGIQPVLSPILVAVVYGEIMGPVSFAGAAIVVIGVLTYNVIKARESTTKSASPV